MKLEINHLAGYLPYGLDLMIGEYVCEIEGIDLHKKDSLIAERVNYNFSEIKPILRPLSDLTKEIKVKGEKFVPIEYFEIGDDDNYTFDFGKGNLFLIRDLELISEYNSNFDIQFLPKIVVDKFFEWHFDIYGLISKSLAIDINTLK